MVAVARPHHLLVPGETAILDGSKSWSADGKVLRYDWTFTDGTTAAGPTLQRKYDRPGVYSEVLKATDAAGHVGIDFAVVQVVDPNGPAPPRLHVAHYPTQGIRPGDAVTFKVRAFGTTHGRETLDFGDGSPPDVLASDGGVDPLAKAGYAVTTHRFAKPGCYVVTARRANEHGIEAVMRTCVIVEP